MKFKGNIAAKLAEYAILEGSYDNVTVVILFFWNRNPFLKFMIIIT